MGSLDIAWQSTLLEVQAAVAEVKAAAESANTNAAAAKTAAQAAGIISPSKLQAVDATNSYTESGTVTACNISGKGIFTGSLKVIYDIASIEITADGKSVTVYDIGEISVNIPFTTSLKITIKNASTTKYSTVRGIVILD